MTQRALQFREAPAPAGLQCRFYELRFEDSERRLTGTAMRYGDIAELPWDERERFEAGAFGDVDRIDAVLNIQHQRARPIARTGGGGLTLRDSAGALEIDAVLPDTVDANDAVTNIRAKILRGLSVEFMPETTRLEDGVNVITKAMLRGIALVDRPAYPASVINARGAAETAEQYIRERADLLVTIKPLLPEGTETRGKSNRELLVLAVGDRVPDAASRSEDYLLGKAEDIAKRRASQSRNAWPPAGSEYAVRSFNVVSMIERRNAAPK